MRIFFKRNIFRNRGLFRSFRLKSNTELCAFGAGSSDAVVNAASFGSTEVQTGKLYRTSSSLFTNHGIGIAGLGVNMNRSALGNIAQGKGIVCTLAIHSGGKMHGNRRGLGILIGFKHLPFVDVDGGPGRSAALVNDQLPFPGGDGFVQQHVGNIQRVIFNALALNPLAGCVFILQAEGSVVHAAAFAAGAAVANQPALNGAFTTQINGHVLTTTVACPPLGGVRTVNGLVAFRAVALLRITGDSRAQTYIFKVGQVDLFGVVIAVGPRNNQFRALGTAHAVAVDGNYFQLYIGFA